MKQGGFMGGEVIILLCLVGFGIYGIIKYTTAENNDYKLVAMTVKDCKSDIAELRKIVKSNYTAIGSIQLEGSNYRKLAEDMGRDVDEVQDHLARTRDSVSDLKHSPQKLEISVSTQSPIPITILDKTPVKKKRIVRRKTGTNRVETRVSPLKGDPDKVPVRKKKAVVKKISKKKSRPTSKKTSAKSTRK